MKRLGITISIFLLAFLVLLGSGGCTIGKMICGGNECSSAYSLGVAKDCCPSENESKEFIESCCCELINVSYSLDDFSVSEKVNVSADPVKIFLTPCRYVFNSPFAISPSSFFSNPSPPESREYLHFIGSLLL